jgi:hypothetical protein
MGRDHVLLAANQFDERCQLAQLDFAVVVCIRLSEYYGGALEVLTEPMPH